MAQPYVGEIRMFAGNFAPQGWMFCDGSLLPISENELLFNLIGTTYGGDGQETFTLPNLQSRVPIHQGSGAILGETAGSEEVTLVTATIPAHSHVLQGSTEVAQQSGPANQVLARTTAQSIYGADTPYGAMAADAIGPVGGGLPHSLGGVDAEERDDVVDAQERLDVRPADRCPAPREHADLRHEGIGHGDASSGLERRDHGLRGPGGSGRWPASQQPAALPHGHVLHRAAGCLPSPRLTGTSVRLRPATSGDEDFLRQLYASTREDELAIVDWTQADKDAFVDMQFRAQSAHYARHYAEASSQIVLVGSEPAGRLAVDRGVDEIRIVDIALLPEPRNRGIGTSLLTALIAEARAGGKTLAIHVERGNQALRLYQRLGFCPVTDDGVYVGMSGHRAVPDRPSREDGLVQDAVGIPSDGHQEEVERTHDVVVEVIRVLSKDGVARPPEHERERRTVASGRPRAELLHLGQREDDGYVWDSSIDDSFRTTRDWGRGAWYPRPRPGRP